MKPKIKKKKNSPSRTRNNPRLNDNDPSVKLRALAQQTERQLNIIQRSMRQRLQAEFARGNLTGPQRLVMSVLVRTQGLSLKQLSEAVSLAHSTVSGIVDRLEKQGLIGRQTHPTDRRITLLLASPPVREFMETRMQELALHPLLEALAHASPTQRKAITQGLNTLAKLLSRTQTPTTSEVFDELDE